MAEGGVNFSEIQHSSIQVGTVVGGNYTLIQHLTSGPDKLPTDYFTRIKNFLREYLGDEKNKVPFGGRAADFATLNQWLTDPDAPACLFMSAEAGRGKSALLARWATYLQQFKDIEVVFIPISIRFETAPQEVFYTALAARLATVYGDEVKYSQLGAEQWKGVADQYLSKSPPDGKQVVVIIDGLDEATGWQPGAAFMPLPLPERVRVVASKRVQANENSNDSLYLLGWQDKGLATSISLPPLELSGVQEVLLSMGNPLDGLADKSEVVKTLFHLTEGDPLVVRLYVEALVGYGGKAIHLTLDDLHQIQPGLKGYFDKWMEQQRRLWGVQQPLKDKTLQTLLAILGCVLGPISRTDILNVAPDTSGLDSFTFDDALAPMRRFIIGDGEQNGFIFSHPRLGYYFHERLTLRERQIWNSRFVTYGQIFLQELKETKKLTWTSEEIESHSYILQQYTIHLDRANAPHADYYALICHEWAQAWEAMRGTYDGFLVDVQKVWKKAESDTDLVKSITMQVWCGLCRSSIVSLSSNISPDLLVGATQTGVLSKVQAIVFLKQTSNTENFLKSVELFSEAYIDDLIFLNQFLTLGETIKDEGARVGVLTVLAPYLPTEVLQSVQTIRDEGARARVLVKIASYLPTEVFQLAQAIENAAPRSAVLIAVARYLPVEESVNVYQEALENTRLLKDEIAVTTNLLALAQHIPIEVFENTYLLQSQEKRAKLLIDLAFYLPEAIKINAYIEALAYTKQVKDKKSRVKLLILLASHLPQEILNIARVTQDEVACSDLLSALAPYLPYEVMMDIEDYLYDEWFQVKVLVNLAPHIPRWVFKYIKNITDKKNCAKLLSALVPFLPSETQPKIRKILFNIREIGNTWSQAMVLDSLVPHMPLEVLNSTKQIQSQAAQSFILKNLAHYLPIQVLEESKYIKEEEECGWVLMELAPYLPLEVLKIARNLQNAHERVKVLNSVVKYLSKDMQVNVYQEALEASRYVGDKINQAWLLSTLVLYIDETKKPNIYEKINEIIRNIQNPEQRTEALSDLSPLSIELQENTYREALVSARQIQDDQSRSNALGKLSPYFSIEILPDVQQLWEDHSKATLLSALIPYLPSETRFSVYKDALISSSCLQDEWARAEVLSTLAPYFPLEVLQTGQQLIEQEERAHVLSALANYLPSEVFLETKKIHIETELVVILRNLAPYMPLEVFSQAKNIKDQEQKTYLLRSLADHLPSEVFEEAGKIKNEKYRVLLLSILAPYNPLKILIEAQRIKNESFRANLLCNLATFLPFDVLDHTKQIKNECTRGEVLCVLASIIPYEILSYIQHFQDQSTLAKILSKLAPHLPTEILKILEQLKDDKSRGEVLISLTPYLTKDAHKVLQNIKDEETRIETIIKIMPYLINEPKINKNFLLNLWREVIIKFSNQPRPDFLNRLDAFISITLDLVKATQINRLERSLTISDSQKAQIVEWLQIYLPYHSIPAKVTFLARAGLSTLEDQFHLSENLTTFAAELIQISEQAGNDGDGEPYLAKLLTCLHNIEWGGDPERKEFLEEILGTPSTSADQQRLAKGISEAVEAVSTWWP